ncbi:hypothetical protein GIB67_001716, partial [Kingdonia uniflora]
STPLSRGRSKIRQTTTLSDKIVDKQQPHRSEPSPINAAVTKPTRSASVTHWDFLTT